MRSVEHDLVSDVGLHVATDSAFYLRRGFRVVAVEANPVLAEEARARFRSQIASGRLTVLGVGIAEGTGEAKFWVCDEWTAWSSFDQSVARRNGMAHHAVTVPLQPLGEIFAEQGLPYYCKVDIEGNDRYALDSMTVDFRPEFLSVEHSEYPFLDRMHSLGYDRFKFIHQLSFSPPSKRWHKLRHLAPHPKLRAGLERLRGLIRGTLFSGRWYFRIGSSGPLPFDTPGRWLTYEQARDRREWLLREFAAGRMTLLDSFDLHATNHEVLAARSV